MNMTSRNVLSNTHGIGNGGNLSGAAGETLEFHNFYRTQHQQSNPLDDEYNNNNNNSSSSNHNHNDNNSSNNNNNNNNTGGSGTGTTAAGAGGGAPGGNGSNFQNFHYPHHTLQQEQPFYSQLLQQNGSESSSGGGGSNQPGIFPFTHFAGATAQQPQQQEQQQKPPVMTSLNLSLGKDVYKVTFQQQQQQQPHSDTTPSSSTVALSFEREPMGSPRFATTINPQLAQDLYGSSNTSEFSSLVLDALKNAPTNQHFDYRFCTQSISDIQFSRLFSSQDKLEFEPGCTMLVLQLALGGDNNGGSGSGSSIIYLPAMLQSHPLSNMGGYSSNNSSSGTLLETRGDNRSRSSSSASLNVIGGSIFGSGILGSVENLSRPSSSFDPLDITGIGSIGSRDSGGMASNRGYGVFGTPFGNGGGSGSSTPRSHHMQPDLVESLSRRVRQLEQMVYQLQHENSHMKNLVHQNQQISMQNSLQIQQLASFAATNASTTQKPLPQHQQPPQQQMPTPPQQPHPQPSQQQQQQQQQQSQKKQQKQRQNTPSPAVTEKESTLPGQWGQRNILNKSAADHVSPDAANAPSQKATSSHPSPRLSAANASKKQQQKRSHENSPRDRSSSSASAGPAVSYTAAAQIAKKAVAPVKVVQAQQHQSQHPRPIVVVAQPPSSSSDSHATSTGRGSPQDITLLVIPIDKKKPHELVVPKKVGVSRERVFDYLTKQNIFTSYASESVSDIELYWKSPMLPEPIIRSNDQQKGLVIYRAAKGKNPFTKVNALFEEYRTDNREDLRIMYGPVVLARQTRSGEVRSFHLRDYEEVVADKKKQALRG